MLRLLWLRKQSERPIWSPGVLAASGGVRRHLATEASTFPVHAIKNRGSAGVTIWTAAIPSLCLCYLIP